MSARHGYLGVILLIVTLLGNEVNGAELAWRHGYGAPTSLDFTAVACRQGPSFRTWVAAGERGSLIVSSNLLDVLETRWHWVNTGTEEWLRDVAASDSQFLAVGDGGVLLLGSPPGAWRRLVEPSGDNPGWTAVARGINGWVAVSHEGRLISISDQGLVASLPSIRSEQELFLTSLRYGGGYYVATGIRGSLFVSSNLTDWIDSKLPTSEPVSRARYGSGRWCVAAGGLIHTSSNGLSWSSRPGIKGTSIWDLAHRPASPTNPSIWIGVGDSGSSYVTTNLNEWFPIRSDYLGPDLRAIEICREQWATVGSRGTFWTAVATPGNPDQNGTRTRWWLNTASPLVNATPSRLPEIQSLSYSGEVLLGMGTPLYQHIQYATNNTAIIGSTGLPGWINHLAWSGNYWLAVGDQGGIYLGPPSTAWRRISTTLDQSSDNVSYVNSSQDLRSSHYHDGTWVSVGEGGAIRVSTNGGKAWLGLPSPTTETLLAVRHGGDRWVAVGENQVIVGSLNGFTWSLLDVGIANRPHAQPGQTLLPTRWILSSPCLDPMGTNDWNPILRFTSEYGNGALNGLDCYQGFWVAVGDGGAVTTSSDGQRWSPMSSLSRDSFLSVRGSPEGWLLSGEDGGVWTSPDGRSWTRTVAHTQSRLTSIDRMEEDWAVAGSGWTTLFRPRSETPRPRLLTLEHRLQWNTTLLRNELVLRWPVTTPPASLQWTPAIGQPFRPLGELPNRQVWRYELRHALSTQSSELFLLTTP